MKKVISLILVSILLLCSIPAIADESGEFTLRNGIKFGDTMEEVMQKETLEFQKQEEGSTVLKTKSGTVSGIDGTYVTYYFSDDNALTDVQYEFKSKTSKDLSDSEYESIGDGLRRKYGDPLGNTNGSCYIVTGEHGALESAVLTTYIFELGGMYSDIRDYDEWALFYPEYNVKIEQVQYYTGKSYSSLDYKHILSYSVFTDEDLEAAINGKQEEKAAVDADL